LAALEKCGVKNAKVSGRNDITVTHYKLSENTKEYKISGSAYKLSYTNQRFMHHGTMLVDVDLNAL